MIYLLILVLGIETVFFFSVGIALRVQRNNSDKLRAKIKEIIDCLNYDKEIEIKKLEQTLKETYP